MTATIHIELPEPRPKERPRTSLPPMTIAFLVFVLPGMALGHFPQPHARTAVTRI
jgi:hypothetical protein